MGILLSELIKMQCFKNSKLAAGTIDKESIVEGITIIEAPDIAEWIKGGELLLTSFYSIDKDLEAQKTLVKKLKEKGAAALIIKTTRFLSKIPSDIIDLGNELGFPIIEITGDTKYIDIMYPVMGEIFNEQVNRLNYYKDCHERFTKLSLDLKGIPAVVKTLEELIDNPVIILDSDFKAIAYNDTYLKDIVIIKDNIIKLEKEGSPLFTSDVVFSTDNESIRKLVIVPILVLNNIKAYLGVLEKHSILKELDYIALESAANTLRLELLKDVAVTEVELKYKGDLIEDLINGRIDSIQNIYDRSNLFGWNLKREFIVVIFNISEYEDYIKKEKRPSEGLHLLKDKIKKILDRISYYYTMDYISINKGDDIIILWPIEKNEKIKDTYTKIKKYGCEVKKVLTNELVKVVVSIGIGGVAENPMEIKKSYSEAKDAVNFGQRVFGSNSITVFDELGVYKLLCSFENRAELNNFVNPALLKLKEHDKDKNNELIETLEMYMKCNLNAVKTAEELFVHYKTVLYRLNRIKEIINLDIENREAMLEIEVGLKILRIMN